MVLIFAEGQPESIVQDIEIMVRSYVEKVIRKLQNRVSFTLNEVT